MQLFERLPRETGRDYALRTIKANIVNLTLEPGSQISENELSGEMGLSRTPVREALSDLARVKIVEICPQKKSTISLIDYDLVEESQFMRNTLERAVMDLVCELATPEDVQKLADNVQQQHFYLEHFNPSALMVLDDQFHELLFQIAKKSLSYQLMRTISIHFDRVRTLALVSVKNLMIVQDHEDMVKAIAAHDTRQAQEILNEHLNRYKVDALYIREKYPQYVKE